MTTKHSSELLLQLREQYDEAAQTAKSAYDDVKRASDAIDRTLDRNSYSGHSSEEDARLRALNDAIVNALKSERSERRAQPANKRLAFSWGGSE